MVVYHSQSYGKWWYVIASLTVNGGLSQSVLRWVLTRLPATAVSATANITPSLFRIKNLLVHTSNIHTLGDFSQEVFSRLTISVFHLRIPHIQEPHFTRRFDSTQKSQLGLPITVLKNIGATIAGTRSIRVCTYVGIRIGTSSANMSVWLHFCRLHFCALLDCRYSPASIRLLPTRTRT